MTLIKDRDQGAPKSGNNQHQVNSTQHWRTALTLQPNVGSGVGGGNSWSASAGWGTCTHTHTHKLNMKCTHTHTLKYTHILTMHTHTHIKCKPHIYISPLKQHTHTHHHHYPDGFRAGVSTGLATPTIQTQTCPTVGPLPVPSQSNCH